MFKIIRNENMNLVDNIFDNFLNERFSIINNNSPDAYFSKDDKNYLIEIALPGANRKDVELHVEDGYLNLSYNNSDDNNDFWAKSFNKRIKIPNDIRDNAINAKLKNGILSIQLQREVKEVVSKKIEIK